MIGQRQLDSGGRLFHRRAEVNRQHRTEDRRGGCGIGPLGAWPRTGQRDISLAVQYEECPSFEIDAGRSVEILNEGARGRQTIQQGPPVATPIHDGNPAVVRLFRSNFGDEEIAPRGLDDFAGAEQASREYLDIRTGRLRHKTLREACAEHA